MDHLPKLKGARGFTLLEVMVASAISVTILGLALSALTDLNRQMARVQQESVANDESKLLNDYISTAMVAVGGGMLRPWTSLWVEDGWGATGADRLTFATLEDLALQCPIERVIGSRLWVDDEHDPCCLSSAFLNRQIIAVSGEPDGNGHWANYRVDDVDLVSCAITLKEGMGAVLDNAPTDVNAWEEGFIAVVHLRQLWIDPAEDHLMVREDFDHDGIIDDRVVADRVIDLQAAMGFDVAPWDWRVDNDGTTDDEWLYNDPEDTFSQGDGQRLEYAQLDELRMVMIGIITGAPTRSNPDSDAVRLLNGPPRKREGWVLRGFLSTTGLRNYDVMR